MDLVSHLTRQAAWSRANFGPGPRTKGVSAHIGEELTEIADVYAATPPATKMRVSVHTFAAREWTDVAILAFDGLLRSIWAANPSWPADLVAEEAATLLRCKQGKNEKREWPDWRGLTEDDPIGHIQGIED